MWCWHYSNCFENNLERVEISILYSFLHITKVSSLKQIETQLIAALPSKVYNTHRIGQAILDSNIMLKPNLIKTKYILTFSLFLCIEFSGAFPISGGQDDFFTLSPHLLQGIDVSQVQDIGKLYIANIR